MSETVPDIKSCPFCGESDAFIERADYSSAYVFCNNCAAHGPIGEEKGKDEGRRQALKKWNSRKNSMA